MDQTTPTGVSDDASDVAKVGLIFLIINTAGLFYWTWIGVSVFGYIALCLIALVIKHDEDDSLSEVGIAMLLLAMLLASIAGVLVGGLQIVAFKHAAYVLIGFFGLSTLTLFGRNIKAFPSILLLVFVTVLCMVVHGLPPPPGSLELEPEPQTVLFVYVRNSNGAGLGYSDVYVQWKIEGQPGPSGPSEHITADSRGDAIYYVKIDPEGKMAILRASSSQPLDRGRYGAAATEVHDVKRGQVNNVEITLPWIATR